MLHIPSVCLAKKIIRNLAQNITLQKRIGHLETHQMHVLLKHFYEKDRKLWYTFSDTLAELFNNSTSNYHTCFTVWQCLAMNVYADFVRGPRFLAMPLFVVHWKFVVGENAYTCLSSRTSTCTARGIGKDLCSCLRERNKFPTSC